MSRSDAKSHSKWPSLSKLKSQCWRLSSSCSFLYYSAVYYRIYQFRLIKNKFLKNPSPWVLQFSNPYKNYTLYWPSMLKQYFPNPPESKWLHQIFVFEDNDLRVKSWFFFSLFFSFFFRNIFYCCGLWISFGCKFEFLDGSLRITLLLTQDV